MLRGTLMLVLLGIVAPSSAWAGSHARSVSDAYRVVKKHIPLAARIRAMVLPSTVVNRAAKAYVARRKSSRSRAYGEVGFAAGMATCLAVPIGALHRGFVAAGGNLSAQVVMTILSLITVPVAFKFAPSVAEVSREVAAQAIPAPLIKRRAARLTLGIQRAEALIDSGKAGADLRDALQTLRAELGRQWAGRGRTRLLGGGVLNH